MPRTRRKSETTNHERIKYIEPATEFGTISLPFSKNGPHLQVFMQLNLLKNDQKACDRLPPWTLWRSQQLLDTITGEVGVLPKIICFVTRVLSPSFSFPPALHCIQETKNPRWSIPEFHHAFFFFKSWNHIGFLLPNNQNLCLNLRPALC